MSLFLVHWLICLLCLTGNYVGSRDWSASIVRIAVVKRVAPTSSSALQLVSQNYESSDDGNWTLDTIRYLAVLAVFWFYLPCKFWLKVKEMRSSTFWWELCSHLVKWRFRFLNFSSWCILLSQFCNLCWAFVLNTGAGPIKESCNDIFHQHQWELNRTLIISHFVFKLPQVIAHHLWEMIVGIPIK